MLSEDSLDLVMHEDVDQFVPEYLIELGQGTVTGNDDPAFHIFEESADTLGEKKRYGVRLLEVAGSAVQDEWYGFEDVMGELALKFRVVLLGPGGKGFGQRSFFSVEVDVKVFGMDHMPVALTVLDLIFTEIVLPLCSVGDTPRGDENAGDEEGLDTIGKKEFFSHISLLFNHAQNIVVSSQEVNKN